MAELPRMISYFCAELEFSICVPEDWTGQFVNPGKLQLFAPEQTAYDDYRPSMSYVHGSPEGPDEGWFEELINDSRANMSRTYNEFRLIDEERFTLSSQALVYARRYEWRDEATGYRFSQMQALIWCDAQSMYLVNAATLQPLAGTFMPTFDAILRSTRIIHRPAKAESDHQSSWGPR